jgi:hypothetical protein
MDIAPKGKTLLRLSFLAALFVVMQARASTIQIAIDATSLGLNGQNWDLAFDLIDGNPQPSSVTIAGFSITGGSLTNAVPFYTSSGNVTGNLSVAPGIVTLNDFAPVPGSFFNEYGHNANLGSLITVFLEITGNMDSGFPRTRCRSSSSTRARVRRFRRRIPVAQMPSSCTASATPISPRRSAPRLPIA